MANPVFFVKGAGWRRASPEKALREGAGVIIDGKKHVGDPGDANSLGRSQAVRRAASEMDGAAAVAPMPASGQPPAIDEQTAATLAATRFIKPKTADAAAATVVAPKGAMDGGMPPAMAGEPPAMRETPAMPMAQNPLMPSPSKATATARGLNPLAAARRAKARAKEKICGVPPAVRG